jgi:hypothetical protein
MAATFKRVGGGRIRVRLGADEATVLRGLPEQLKAVLAEGGADPVNRRLLPPAYLEPDDAERDAEYRRLMHDELVEGKLANLDVVAGTLARGAVGARRWTVDLTEEEASAWLGALNDLRLALGVRLEITEDFDGQVDDGDPRAPAMHLLSYLGWLEEHLLEALSA